MGLFKKSFIILTLLYVLFFVKTWGSVTGLLYTHDDVVYYAQTASLVNELNVDIKNNLGPYNNLYLGIQPQTGKMMSYQPLGPSLLYIIPYSLTKPFVYFISLLRGVSFDEYDPLFFVVLCFYIFILFYFSGVILRKTLSLFFSQSLSDIVAIFTLWGTILPVYVFRRPIFGVVPELFLSTLLLYFAARYYKDNKLTIFRSMWLGLIAGFLFITRWNDAYLLLFYLSLLVYTASRSKEESGWVKVFVVKVAVFLVVLSLFFILTQGMIWKSIYGSVVGFISNHSKIISSYINSTEQSRRIPGLFINAKNLVHVILGTDWGVIFTMPILLLGGAGLILSRRLQISSFRAIYIILIILTFFAPFYIILKWKTTGEFYGYRFLISLLPFSAIGFSELIEAGFVKYRKLIVHSIIGFCLFNFLVILPFEFTEKTTLQPQTVTPMGGVGWGNNAYFLNAVSFYFQSDFKALVSNFSRGYLAAIIFGIYSLFNVDLIKFSPKIKAYFSLTGYKNYVAFIYLLLIILWAWYLKITGKTFRQKL